MKTRASRTDLLLACAASSTEEISIDMTSPAARLGQCVHAAIAAWINAGAIEEPEPQPFANQYDVDVHEVELLCGYAPYALRSIKEALDNMRAEVSMENATQTGTADVLSTVEMEGGGIFHISIVDWKTGRDSTNPRPGQMTAYASLAESTYGMPPTGYIYTAEIWLRDKLIIERRIDLDTILGFRRRLEYQRQNAESYQPGKHCRFCHRSLDCAARDAHYRAACGAISELKTRKTLTRNDIADLWDQSRALKFALEQYESLVDEMLDEGEMNLPDGRKLIRIEQQRDKIDARAAWPIMAKYGMTQDDIAKSIYVKKSEMLAAVAKRAPRRKKTETKNEMMRELWEAGAVTSSSHFRRKVVQD